LPNGKSSRTANSRRSNANIFHPKDDEVYDYRVAHQTGHKGKCYLTVAGIENKTDASLKDVDPNRVVLTTDKNSAYYLWTVFLSGK